MKTAELRQKDVAGLQAEVKSLQRAHFNLRMQKATQQLNNTATLRQTRRPLRQEPPLATQRKSQRCVPKSISNLGFELFKDSSAPRGRFFYAPNSTSASRWAHCCATWASRASTITRTKGSVPLGRISTRPASPKA